MQEKLQGVCVVIPACREAGRIGLVVARVKEVCEDVIVVDDGSDDNTAAEAESAGARVVRHAVNRGKGAALNTGFAAAAGRGFRYVVTMDGDGQHDPADIRSLVDAAESTGAGVVVGNRMACPRGMPWVRRCVNRLMSALLSRRMGRRIPDTQCGFRLYAVPVLEGLAIGSERFEAESEILLALAARGEKIEAAPVKLIYAGERSKIRPIADTIRFFRMLRRVCRHERPAEEGRK